MRRPGRHGGAYQVAALLAAGFVAFALLLAACGGDDDQESPSPEASAAPAKSYTAETLLPDLSSLDLRQAEKQQDPAAAAAGQDSWGAIYTGKYSVQVRITVLPDAKAARSQFDTLAVALRNPPEEFVGAGVAQVDNPAVTTDGSSKGYVTQKPDANGRLVWTDVSLVDRAVVIVQVLGKDSGDTPALRKAILDKIAAETK